MTLRLHWSPKSPYVRKVMICAHELGMADRLELVRSVLEKIDSPHWAEYLAAWPPL